MIRLLYAVCVFLGVYVSGPILYAVTGNSFIANWLSIIIPCIIIGFIIGKFNNDFIYEAKYMKLLALLAVLG